MVELLTSLIYVRLKDPWGESQYQESRDHT